MSPLSNKQIIIWADFTLDIFRLVSKRDGKPPWHSSPDHLTHSVPGPTWAVPVRSVALHTYAAARCRVSLLGTSTAPPGCLRGVTVGLRRSPPPHRLIVSCNQMQLSTEPFFSSDIEGLSSACSIKSHMIRWVCIDKDNRRSNKLYTRWQLSSVGTVIYNFICIGGSVARGLKKIPQ